jgi:hypothetical protein
MSKPVSRSRSPFNLSAAARGGFRFIKKLTPIGIIAIICLIGLGIVLGARSSRPDTDSRSNEKSAQPRAEMTTGPIATPVNTVPTATPPPEMPEHLKFIFLFEHLANIKDKPGVLRRYQEKTGLADATFSVLVQLAVEHEQQASIIDKQAQIIIDNIHAQYPRHLPPGVSPPAEPPELLDLQDREDALALTFRDRVRTQLGEETYARFKQFIDEEFGPKLPIRQMTPPTRPVLTQKEDK